MFLYGKIYTPVCDSRYNESSFFQSSAESADEQEATKLLTTKEIEDLLIKKDEKQRPFLKEKKKEIDLNHEG